VCFMIVALFLWKMFNPYSVLESLSRISQTVQLITVLIVSLIGWTVNSLHNECRNATRYNGRFASAERLLFCTMRGGFRMVNYQSELNFVLQFNLSRNGMIQEIKKEFDIIRMILGNRVNLNNDEDMIDRIVVMTLRKLLLENAHDSVYTIQFSHLYIND